jgi:hypothetical protein
MGLLLSTADLLLSAYTAVTGFCQQAMGHQSTEMTRHYTHAFEDQAREAIESLPDLTQPSRKSQAAVKTGTDNQILLNSCFDSASLRSITQTSGKENLDGILSNYSSALLLNTSALRNFTIVVNPSP